MLIIGLLLMAASGAFVALLIGYNTSGGPSYTVHMFGNTIATLNTLEIFCAGLALALIFCFGALVSRYGAHYYGARQRKLREARRHARDVEAERDELAKRVERTEQSAPPPMTTPPGPPASDAEAGTTAAGDTDPAPPSGRGHRRGRHLIGHG
jgi:hypothetical protein